MLPMELQGKLRELGYKNIKHVPLSYIITHRHQNSHSRFIEEGMAVFALIQGVPQDEVAKWRKQLAEAEQAGRFGFVSYPVLTSAYLSK